MARARWVRSCYFLALQPSLLEGPCSRQGLHRAFLLPKVTCQESKICLLRMTGKLETGATSVIYLIDSAESSASAATRDSYVVRDSSSLQVIQLLRNTAYFFTVVAQNNRGKLSAPSERGVFTTLAALPAQMDPPTISQSTYGLLLTWNPLVSSSIPQTHASSFPVLGAFQMCVF